MRTYPQFDDECASDKHKRYQRNMQQFTESTLKLSPFRHDIVQLSALFNFCNLCFRMADIP